jgi:hypothetical protein
VLTSKINNQTAGSFDSSDTVLRASTNTVCITTPKSSVFFTFVISSLASSKFKVKSISLVPPQEAITKSQFFQLISLNLGRYFLAALTWACHTVIQSSVNNAHFFSSLGFQNCFAAIMVILFLFFSR